MEQSPLPRSDAILAELRLTLAAIDTQIWRAEIKAMVIAYVTAFPAMSLATYVLWWWPNLYAKPAVIWWIGATILLLLAATTNAFLCAAPRLGILIEEFALEQPDAKSPGASVLDLEMIRHFRSPGEYLQRVGADVESIERVRDLYSEQVWTRSKICHAKRLLVGWSVVFLSLSIVSLLVVYIVLRA